MNNDNSKNRQDLANSKLFSRKGFSLFEVAIVIIISGIILSTTISIYIHYLDIHNRQERVLFTQRSLATIEETLREVLTNLVGQGLSTTNGEIFSIPILPIAGSAPDQNGKISPIQLNILTPYKINGFDAFTIAYADPKLPRFLISENIKVDAGNGKVRIALPFYSPGKTIPLPGNSPTDLGLVNSSNNSNSSDSNSSSVSIPNGLTNTTNTTNIIIPPHTPTPTPTPSPIGTPTPNPVPPSVPFNSTVLGQNWIPTIDMFHVGDTMLLVTAPGYSDTDPTTTQTYSRLVNITSVTQFIPTLAGGGSGYIEIGFSYCLQGSCGTQFPGLTNNSSLAAKTGSVLAPLRLSSFYLKKDDMGSRLIRNDGGVILPTGSGSFQIQGGKESVIGETDQLTINYHLLDGSTEPTPNTPIVPWLSKINSVDISLSVSVPATKGTEQINEKITTNCALSIRSLQ